MNGTRSLFLSLFCTLLLSLSALGIEEVSSVITEYEQRDLQLFRTYQGRPGLVKHIDRTHTAMGHRYLESRLANPITDITKLSNTQKSIQGLLEDPNLLNALDAELATFAHYEQSLDGGNCSQKRLADTVVKSFYFSNSYCTWLNKYPSGLELGQIGHILNLSAPLLEHVVMHYLISEKLRETFGICGHSHHNHGHKKKHGHHEGRHDYREPTLATRIAYNLYNVGHTAIHLIGFKGLVDHVRERFALIYALQTNLINIHRCIKSAQMILELLESKNDITQSISNFTSLSSLFREDQSQTPELKEFLNLIMSNTFSGEASYFSRQGVILRAHALAQTVRQELKEKLRALAAIDVAVSCAKLYKEYENTNTPFTFAQYKIASTPSSTIQGFWNPLIEESQSIDDTISLGGNDPQIAIVTGPNKAGKSTGVSAITLAVLLAQTITLVPARFCEITPFSSIKTGFNMMTRVNQDQSLFSASLDFAQAILRNAQVYKERFIFIAADELLNSTDFQQGVSIATKFLGQLGQCPNCIACITTHFRALTELENEQPSTYKNFQATLHEENDQATYTLRPGKSDASTALRHIPIADLDFNRTNFL